MSSEIKREHFSLRPMGDADIDLVLEWRNSDRVRTKMFEHHTIPKEDHSRWYASLKGNPLQKCWMFEYQGRAIGVVTIKNVDLAQDVWIWGCYLGPMKACPNAGTIMGYCAQEHFFEQMKVKKVIGEAVAANVRSLEFNARIGFDTEKRFMKANSRGEPIEAVLLVLTQEQWLKRKDRVQSNAFNGLAL